MVTRSKVQIPKTSIDIGNSWLLTIHGKPRTKKTANEIHLTVGKGDVHRWLGGLGRLPAPQQMRGVLSRVRVQPSKLYRQWVRDAVMQWKPPGPPAIINQPVCLSALIYRDRDIGDVQGFQQAIADYLEAKLVIANDRLVEHWDGTRRLKDAAHPRVEVTITTCERATAAPSPRSLISQAAALDEARELLEQFKADSPVWPVDKLERKVDAWLNAHPSEKDDD